MTTSLKSLFQLKYFTLFQKISFLPCFVCFFFFFLSCTHNPWWLNESNYKKKKKVLIIVIISNYSLRFIVWWKEGEIKGKGELVFVKGALQYFCIQQVIAAHNCGNMLNQHNLFSQYFALKLYLHVLATTR